MTFVLFSFFHLKFNDNNKDIGHPHIYIKSQHQQYSSNK